MREQRKYRVGISGSYGGLNLGDEAILHSIVTELRRSLPVEVTVFGRNAEDTLARHRVERAVTVRELSRREVAPEIARLDLFILGGGGILYDRDVHIYLREVQLAQQMDVPVMVYGVGAGPLETPAAQQLVRECLERADVVTVRHHEAARVLENAGVQRDITITADPAFLLEPEPCPPGGLECEAIARLDRMVAVSVREPGPAAPDIQEEDYHTMLAYAADYMVERYDVDLVFVPMEPNVKDIQQSYAVLSRMARAPRAMVLRGDYTPGQLLGLVGHAVFAFGMRLHFLIFAALQRVPFVGLPYAGKVSGLLETFDLPRTPMKQVTTGQLIAHLDRAWDQREQLREHVESRLPAIREAARETNRLAVELLLARGKPREVA